MLAPISKFRGGDERVAYIYKRLRLLVAAASVVSLVTIGMAVTVRSDRHIFNSLCVVFMSGFAVFQSINQMYLVHVTAEVEASINESKVQVAQMVSGPSHQEDQLLKRLKYFRIAMYGNSLGTIPLPVVMPTVYFTLGSFPFFYVIILAIQVCVALLFCPALLYLLFGKESEPASNMHSKSTLGERAAKVAGDVATPRGSTLANRVSVEGTQ
jgi:hypothetical protein